MATEEEVQRSHKQAVTMVGLDNYWHTIEVITFQKEGCCSLYSQTEFQIFYFLFIYNVALFFQTFFLHLLFITFLWYTFMSVCYCLFFILFHNCTFYWHMFQKEGCQWKQVVITMPIKYKMDMNWHLEVIVDSSVFLCHSYCKYSIDFQYKVK
jgi:hypothetical protein